MPVLVSRPFSSWNIVGSNTSHLLLPPFLSYRVLARGVTDGQLAQVAEVEVANFLTTLRCLLMIFSKELKECFDLYSRLSLTTLISKWNYQSEMGFGEMFLLPFSPGDKLMSQVVWKKRGEGGGSILKKLLWCFYNENAEEFLLARPSPSAVSPSTTK